MVDPDPAVAAEAAIAPIVDPPEPGAVATMSELPGRIAAAATVEEVEEIQADADKEGKRWERAVVVVGNHKFPGDKRPVIVVEQRTVGDDGTVTLKTEGYPAGADLYYRTDEAVEFPKSAKQVITLGVTINQGSMRGFSRDPLRVNVGPASPAYAGANLAFQRGAERVEIIGLTDAEKEHLQPWLDQLATAPRDSAPTKVVLS